ncbi:MAG: queuosine precursor transporter [Propionibacteriaceae bacterium]|nr:queuosine precursor transporter [Propionibacteriaceae bacterium]
MPKIRENSYAITLALFCSLLLISNVAATKLIVVGPLTLDGGFILFPLTYILGDVLAEVFGWQLTRRAIFLSFALAALMSLTFWAVDLMAASPDWPLQEAWHSVLGFVPRIVVASLLAYLAGQLLNAVVLVRIRERWGPKRLGVRLIASTVVGEFADTCVFGLIAFGPLGAIFGGDSLDFATLVNYVLVGWGWKTLVEVVFLPVTYRVIAFVRGKDAAQ